MWLLQLMFSTRYVIRMTFLQAVKISLVHGKKQKIHTVDAGWTSEHLSFDWSTPLYSHLPTALCDYHTEWLIESISEDASRWADLHWGVCVRCREQQERAMWQSRGILLLDYVKHSHSPEVAAPLWKLKASQRFTVFVRRRLSHSHSDPAPTRYTLHGRLLWTTTTTTSAAGMSICLHEEKGWKEGWGVTKKRGTERRKLGCWYQFELAVTDEIWLINAPYSAFNGHTKRALNLDSPLI